MAKIGTQIVSIAVLEQDLYASIENFRIIAEEAKKRNMLFYVVPSRWGGIVAGAPKVPSYFTIMNEDTWIVNKDGSYASGVSGRISSIFHPKTILFMKEKIREMMNLWPVDGVVFDEPKTFMMDYNPWIEKNKGKTATWEDVKDQHILFYSELCAEIKNINKETETNLFVFANTSDEITETMAKIKGLDYYGCDGRPWSIEDGGKQESKGKTLLGPGERHLKEAKKAGKKTLWLIENHNMLNADVELFNKRIEEIKEKKVDQLIYYYYPRNIESPDYVMNAIANGVKNYSMY
jgi:hypothetical protein